MDYESKNKETTIILKNVNAQKGEKIMTHRIKIKYTDVYSSVIFFSCVEIPSLMRRHGQNYLFLARIVLLIVLIMINSVKSKYRKNTINRSVFNLITVWMLFLMFSTYLRGHDILYACRILSIPYLMAVYIYVYNEKIMEILQVWKNLLALVIIIDFITIIIFPNGMYNDGLYDLNWFLGYKTARFQLELPLCILSAYISKMRKGKVSLQTYVYTVISMICVLKARSTSSFVCLLMFAILLLIIGFCKRIKNGSSFLHILFNYNVIMIGYIVAVVSLIYINNSLFIQTFVVQILHKDVTLSTRTYIWEMMLKKIVERPFVGYGVLDQATYVSITNSPFANSTHSMALCLLMEGGIIGTLIYIMILRKSFIEVPKTSSNLIIHAGIIILLIVGLTSVSMVYCEFSMVLFEIVCMNSRHLTGGLYERDKVRCDVISGQL